jgi:spermidine synthase
MSDVGFKKPVYLGLMFVSLATLMLELTLTRIFSVTLWYHFAFMAVSLALFGSAAGGVFVYLFARYFAQGNIRRQLPIITVLFVLTILLAAFATLNINVPFFDAYTGRRSLGVIFVGLAAIYAIVAVPFFFSGLCLSLILTKFAHRVSTLYFFDLLGAGLGAVLTIPALNLLGGPTALLLCAAIAGLGGVMFALGTGFPRQKRLALLTLALATTVVVANQQFHFLDVRYVKGEREQDRLFTGWNSFSRVSVFEQGEGRRILIDGLAATNILPFDGDLTRVAYLSQTLVALPYYIMESPQDAKVLVIGPGGGVDVLVGLVMGSRNIVGVEYNPLIVDLVRNRYAAIAGDLYRRPGVTIVTDEARSYIRRTDERYDLIQAIAIDTWAATSAGAFTFAESYLYTEEAFLDYWDHLTEKGIIAFTRFYSDPPAQILRLASLGLAAMVRRGIPDPSQHLFIVVDPEIASRVGEGRTALMLLSRTPFSAVEIATLEKQAAAQGWNVVYSPAQSTDTDLARLIRAPDPIAFTRSYPFDVSPPTDDRPFFFHLLRLGDFLKAPFLRTGQLYNYHAIFVLGSLLIISGLLVSGIIVGPLLVFKRRLLKERPGLSPLFYFACLGLGFMLVELALMQRFILFLGHPIYALAVVLFSLLVFSGLGSRSTSLLLGRVPPIRLLRIVLLMLIILLAIYAVMLSPVFYALVRLELAYRILAAVILLAPLGFLMGMPFPLGIRIISQRSADIVPWVWGINGATSVLGTVLALTLAMNFGFTVALGIGILSYVAGWQLAGLMVGRTETIVPGLA